MAQEPYTGVPTVEATAPAQPLIQAQATPNDFGSQVGQQLEGAGEKGQSLGSEYMNQAVQLQGMVNETLMTKASTDLDLQNADVKGALYSKSGMDAFNYLPVAKQQMLDNMQKMRSTLPPGAQRGFDLLNTRQFANSVTDMTVHATNELKSAQRDSAGNMANASALAMSDYNNASNPERVANSIGDAKYAVAMQLDHTAPNSGLTTDSDGNVKFDMSTDDGILAHNKFTQDVDNAVSKVQINRFNTLSNKDPMGAYSLYQQERNDIPKQGQVTIDAMLQPKVFQAQSNDGQSKALQQAVNDHAEMLYNPGPKNAIDMVMRNEGGASPDGHAIYGIDKNAFPDQFAQAQQITQTQGAAAGQTYARNFYKTEIWDKKGISDLPAQTQAIVMDGAVNHSTAFSNQLIQSAKDGATPDQLIDMRRNEYQRLANADPSKYGGSLAGWMNRLDNVQSSTSGPAKPYATNEQGSPMTQADYFRMHSLDVYSHGDRYAEQIAPGDLKMRQAVHTGLEQYMSATIANQSQQYKQDSMSVTKAIDDAAQKGHPIQTVNDLNEVPGMRDLLGRVAVQSPDFYRNLPQYVTQAAKFGRGETTNNSPNAYDAITRTLLDPSSDSNAIKSQDQLYHLIGEGEGLGINMKDYNDAKKVLAIPESDRLAFGNTVRSNMDEIKNHGGNVDGNGQQRAVTWYNQFMQAYEKNQTSDKKLTTQQLIDQTNGVVAKPSWTDQLSTWANSQLKQQFTDKSIFGGKASTPIAKPPEGQVSVMSPDGKVGYIPQAQLQEALSSGYKAQ